MIPEMYYISSVSAAAAVAAVIPFAPMPSSYAVVCCRVAIMPLAVGAQKHQ